MRKEACPKCGIENALIMSAHNAQINGPKNHGRYEARDHAEVLRCFNPDCGFVIEVEEPQLGDLEAIEQGRQDFARGDFVTWEELKKETG
jgi:hypothetical protein